MSNVFGYIPGNDAGGATSIALTPDDTLGQYFIPFSKTSKKKNNKLYIDKSNTPLTYDPSTGSLTATTFVGAVAATNISLTQDASTASNYLIMSTTPSGVSTLRTSVSGATYNATNNTANLSISGNAGSADTATNQSGGTVNATTGSFSSNVGINGNLVMGGTNITGAVNINATTFAGALDGTASKADQIKVTRNGINAVHYLTFSDSNPNPSGYVDLHTNAGIKCNPAADTITAGAFIGALSGNADSATQVTVTLNDSNVPLYPVFVTGVGATKDLLCDSGVPNITYTPDVGLLTSEKMALVTQPAANDNSLLVPSTAWTKTLLSNGTAGSATTVTISSSVDPDIYNIPFCLGTGTGRTLRSDSILQYDTTVSPPNITADLNGTASLVKISSDSTSGSTHYLSYAVTGGGSKNLMYNTGSNALSYVPLTGTLTSYGISLGRGATSAANGINLLLGNSVPTGLSFVTGFGRQTIIGNFAGQNITSSSYWNTLLGDNAGSKITSGAGNVCLGYLAGPSSGGNATGNNNVCVGLEAGAFITSGQENTAIGPKAAKNLTTGSNNTCIGNSAGLAIVGTGLNTFIGALCGPQNISNPVTLSGNVAIGYKAGNALVGTAEGNTLIGTQSGDRITTGFNNCCIGNFAGSAITTANDNLVIGNLAADTTCTGNNNLIFGNNAASSITGSGNIIIGNAAATGGFTNSDRIVIGLVTQSIFLQGGFNFRLGNTTYGSVITNSTNGNLNTLGEPLAQFYHVTMSAAGQTITLPNPAIAEFKGQIITFKRRTNTTVFTLTSTGGLGFIPIGSVTLSASPHTVANTVFNVTLMADGVNWNIINQA